jgi:hypothetical protein
LVAAVPSIVRPEGLTALTPSFLLSLLLVVVAAALTVAQRMQVVVAAQEVAALGKAALAALALRVKAITAAQVNPLPIILMVMAAVAAVLAL